MGQWEKCNTGASAARIVLDRPAAPQSASWGLGQVMGENFAIAGFADVEAMVEAEDAQLAAMARFIEHRDLSQHLRNEDWSRFAYAYNGPRYATNQYDVKLAAAYARRKLGPLPDFLIREIQMELQQAGLNRGPIDGVMRNKTRRAIEAYVAGGGQGASIQAAHREFT